MVCAAIEPAILMMTFGVPPNNAGRRTARAVCAVVVKTTQDVLIARLASRVVGTQVKEAALLLDLADVSLRTPDEEAKWESSFVRAVIIGTRAVLYGVFSPAGQRIPGVPDVIDGAFASLYGRQLADERRALARELIKQYDSPHR